MDQVEEIKSKIDIVQLISEYTPLKKAGRNFKGLCPFHGEKSPSFMVNPELSIWKCFGCQKGGDAYAFLQNIEGYEFGEALKVLADRAGVKLISYRPTQVEEIKDKLIAINSLAANVYHYMLTKHKWGTVALVYLQGRKISPESIETFKIGFAPDSWDFMTNFLLGKKKMAADDVVKAGLIVAGKNYDRFRNRIMFPLNNSRGQTVGFSGRVLPGASEKEGGKYVNTSETEIYHKSELLYALDITRGDIKAKNLAVVVEGEVDAIASYQSGVKHVVAIKGSALTARQVEILRRLCDTAVLALDADFAGDAAVRRGIEMAEKGGLIIKVVSPSEKYKDPGEWATEDPYGWARAVEEAIPIYDFYLQSAVKRFGLDIVGKKRISQELLPIWASIEDEIVKGHYIKQLARVLEVEEDDIRIQLGKTQVPVYRAQPTSPLTKLEVLPEQLTTTVGRELLEKYLLELALKGKKTKELEPLVFRHPFWKKAAELVAQGTELAKMPAEIKPQLQELFLLEDEYQDKEWERAVEKLEEIETRQSLRHETDPEIIDQLSKKLSGLTKSR
jgi:DNA primase